MARLKRARDSARPESVMFDRYGYFFVAPTVLMVPSTRYPLGGTGASLVMVPTAPAKRPVHSSEMNPAPTTYSNVAPAMARTTVKPRQHSDFLFVFFLSFSMGDWGWFDRHKAPAPLYPASAEKTG
jgi:hypothetical protein